MGDELGERRIIQLILGKLRRMPGMVVPFGDDVSAVDLGGGQWGVLKADMLVGRTDVPRGMTLRQAAAKAVVMGVSDLASKGVRPTAGLVSLGLPRGLREGDVSELAGGLNEAAERYGLFIVGGDTNEADDLIINIAIFATAREGELILRSGARVGDVLITSGPFGKTAAGLKHLVGELPLPPSFEEAILRAVYAPEARLEWGLELRGLGGTASIDSSDGLAWSLHELSQASGVGFEVERLPVAEGVEVFAEAQGLDPFDLVFYGGEEYEIVATVNPARWREAAPEARSRWMEIGRAVEGEEMIFKGEGAQRKIEARGWEHFKS